MIIVADVVSEAVGDHIARHDPARALREVAAKRAIVEAYRQSRDILMDNRETWDLVRAAVGAQRVTVTRLAAVWSDHPDYRAEWRPDATALPDHGRPREATAGTSA
jgi:hypothetical protein